MATIVGGVGLMAAASACSYADFRRPVYSERTVTREVPIESVAVTASSGARVRESPVERPPLLVEPVPLDTEARADALEAELAEAVAGPDGPVAADGPLPDSAGGVGGEGGIVGTPPDQTDQTDAAGQARVLVESDLINLAQADISDATIVSLVRISRVEVEVNADRIVEWRVLGMSDEVIQAIIDRVAQQEREVLAAPGG